MNWEIDHEQMCLMACIDFFFFFRASFIYMFNKPLNFSIHNLPKINTKCHFPPAQVIDIACLAKMLTHANVSHFIRRETNLSWKQILLSGFLEGNLPFLGAEK